MPSFTLIDPDHDSGTEARSITPADLGLPATPAWSVTMRTLRGGRRDGVDLLCLDNGALALEIVPTRGMGLWRGRYHADRLGWDSPVTDGPVHPALVNLADLGGLGFLHGFDELLARCGLEHNGAPFVENGMTHPLHGRIANIPAHRVVVHVEDQAPHAICVEGHVDEARLFGPRVRLVARVTTEPGSNRAVVRDELTNLGDLPAEVQLLYHWNFGPPYLEEGSRFAAPARVVVPRTARAAEGIGQLDTYAPPEPGFAEQVYFFELFGAGPEGRTLALLRDRAGTRGVALRFATRQLPCFSLWKNTGGLRSGYVTGLEPATNYPNPRPYEAARRRVVTLEPGASYTAETTLEVLDTSEAVAAIEAEIADLQRQGAPQIHQGPVEPYAAP